MSREVAKMLLEIMLRQGAELDAFLIDIEGECTEQEFSQLKTIVGKVMGSILLDAINPIVAKYPDLKPRQLR
jgi:hypothetical protein